MRRDAPGARPKLTLEALGWRLFALFPAAAAIHCGYRALEGLWRGAVWSRAGSGRHVKRGLVEWADAPFSFIIRLGYWLAAAIVMGWLAVRIWRARVSG
jgi:hypothetical protein